MKANIDYGLIKALLEEGLTSFYDEGLSVEMIEGPAKLAFQFIESYRREHGLLPEAAIVREETAVDVSQESLSPVKYWSDHVKKRFRLANLRIGMEEAITLLEADDPNGCYESLRSMIFSIDEKVPLTQRPISIFDVDIIRSHYEKLKDKTIDFPTPWPTLTNRIMGWQPEDLTTIVARSGVGKTFLLLLMLLAIYKQGKKVLLVSTEMKYSSMMMRASSFLTQTNYTKLRTGSLSYQEESALWNLLEVVKGNRNFLIFGEGFDVSLEHVESQIIEEKPDVVGIDGAYLLKSQRIKRRDRADFVGQIWEGLKGIAKRHKLPLIAVSQMNRSANTKNKKGDHDRVAFSEDITRVSDNLIFAERTDEEIQENKLRLVMGKLREADSHEDIIINWDFESQNFSELCNHINF